jgi:hypothetical protein
MSETPTPLTLEQIAGGIRHRMGQQPSAQYIFVPRDWLEIVLSALQDVRAEAMKEKNAGLLGNTASDGEQPPPSTPEAR